MTTRWERAASVLLTGAAVVMALGIGYRAVMPAQSQRLPAGGAMDSVPNWRNALPIGFRDGPEDAPVTIVELADLECPACRAFQPTLDQMQRAYPDKLAVVWINFPLPYHRFARAAARAGACAEQAGRFDEWRQAVFANQDSLGLKSWGAYAAGAGIADTSAIVACARSSASVGVIQAGLQFGSSIGLTGTPTVIINGWRFPSPPQPGPLKAAIEAELAGHRPPGAQAGSG